MSTATPSLYTLNTGRRIREVETIGFSDLVALVEKHSQFTYDQTIPAQNLLRLDDKFKLTTTKGLNEPPKPQNRFHLSENALQQLCAKMQIPTRYAKRIMDLTAAQDPEGHIKKTLQEQANYWLERLPNKPAFARYKGDPDSGTMLVRAILSDKYRIFDNRHVVEALKGLGSSNVIIQKPYIDENRFNVRLILPDFKCDISPEGKSVGDILYGCLEVGNSETGCGGTAVDMLAWRLTCTNGAKMPHLISKFRIAHVQSGPMENPEELYKVLCEHIDKIGLYLAEVGKRFKAGHEVPVEDPIEELKQLAEEMGLPDYMKDKLAEAFLEEAYNNVFGVANAITLAAQAQDLDRRKEMEAFAGTYLNRQTKSLVLA